MNGITINSGEKQVNKRIFLVGCPRSGTTLLQAMITAHPQVISFPESHFFRYLYPARSEKFRYFLKLVSEKENANLRRFLTQVNDNRFQIPFMLFPDQYIQYFVRYLDEITIQKHKQIWLEKTPGHVQHIEAISKKIRDVYFIHIIRNGENVVASLYETSRQNPKVWGCEWTIDQCIDRWKKDVRQSEKYCTQKNHIVIRYESLVQDTEKNLEQICDFLDISYLDSMIQNYARVSRSLVVENEIWKASVQEPLFFSGDTKFKRIFTQEEQNYILEKISRVSLDFVMA